jgi:hypothetical protein
MKGAANVAVVSLWLLTTLIVSNAVPPAEMLLGLNDLEIVGAATATVSLSLALQTPAEVHPAPVLLLLMVLGGVITAVLVTFVWADAWVAIVRHKKGKSRPTTSARTRNDFPSQDSALVSTSLQIKLCYPEWPMFSLVKMVEISIRI